MKERTQVYIPKKIHDELRVATYHSRIPMGRLLEMAWNSWMAKSAPVDELIPKGPAIKELPKGGEEKP